ncbi:unnamed protein product, partial [Acanthocheilonema viteae]
MKVDWYNNCALRRTLAIYGFVLIWLITELNTFFLKHIFAVDTSHPLVFSRIFLLAFISAPTIRQFYLFATDPRIKRMGMQSWVYVAICTLEASICIKFGRPQLPRVKLTLIVSWICFMAVGTFASVWMSVWWVKTFTKTKKVNINGCLRDCYLDSSHENLGTLTDELVNFTRSFCCKQTCDEVRVRFAPSPTGNLHLGGLRTALYNFLFARSQGGKFILRIEDTDQQRLVPGAVQQIEATLDRYKLFRDEGPSNSGKFGPYLQSERKAVYRDAVEQLIDSGNAYRCFCTKTRLDMLRREAARRHEVPKYDNHCRGLTYEEVKRRLENGENYAIRFKLERKEVCFEDQIFGEITQNSNEGDFILMKTDSFPTYHLANVVDDHQMRISHVIRGSEWLTSVSKHIQLY